ncbi:MAG: hypothetical protein AAGA48_14425 [Myxococcota bacterium]
MLYLFAFASAEAVIFAGNPGEFELDVVATEGPVVETSLLVASLTYKPCDTSLPDEDVSWPVDLDASTTVDVPTVAGDFCSLVIQWDGTGYVSASVGGTVRTESFTDGDMTVDLSGSTISAPLTNGPEVTSSLEFVAN